MNGIKNPCIKITIGDEENLALIDTGASVSLISPKLVKEFANEISPINIRVCDASQNPIPIRGALKCTFDTPEGKFNETILVYHDCEQMNLPMILGMNVLSNSNINCIKNRINFNNNENKNTPYHPLTIKIKTDKICNPSNLVSNTKIRTIEEEQTGKPPERVKGYKGKPAARMEGVSGNIEKVSNCRGEEDQRVSMTSPQAGVSESESAPEPPSVKGDSLGAPDLQSGKEKKVTAPVSFNIHLLEDVTLKRNMATGLKIRCSKSVKNKTLLINRYEIKPGLLSANVVTKEIDGFLTVNIMNTTNKPIKLTQGTFIGTADPYDEEKINLLNTNQDKTENNGSQKARELTEDDISCESESHKAKLLKLLNQYRNTCWQKGERLGNYIGPPLTIKTTSDKIINKKQYQIPHSKQKGLDDCIQGMLQEGIIQKSKSPYNSPLIIIQKANGELRPVIDYREINKITQPLTFPLPRVSDLLNSMGNAKIISSLDLASAYHQCDINEEDRPKTAFTVKNSKYEFTRVPFGLTGAPGYFSGVINDVLYDVLGPQVFCYLDDILVFAQNENEHLVKLEQVLQRLSAANIKLKLSKCRFFTNEVKFLGYKITNNGIKMDPEKIEAIKKMPHPKNKKELQALLGAINYYRMFVSEFAKIADPLYELLRKGRKYEWGNSQEEAVEKLKETLAKSPILKFPDFNRDFIIHTDASLTGIGACLMQVHNGVLHPVSYVSKCFTETQRGYSTTKREALALVFALEQFRQTILGYPIHVFTDHRPLTSILMKDTKDATLNRWSLLVQEYAIKVHFLPGKENWLADTLSRLSNPTSSANSIPSELNDKLIERVNICSELDSFLPEKLPWLESELRDKQKVDEECKNIRKSLKKEPKPSSKLIKFKIINGLLYVHRNVKRGNLNDEFLVPYIPSALMTEAFKVIHTDITAGHKGHERTLKIFIRNFYHPQEVKILKKLIDECPECIQAKSRPKEVPIKKFPIPTQPFHTVSIDLLGPLHKTARNNRFVMVLRDTTTRYTALQALKNKETESIIEALRNINAFVGSSQILISDNAQEFVSEKLKRFLKFYNCKKVEVSPYHPASNGLAERINQEVAKLLRIYTNAYSLSWDELLPSIQLSINNTYNSSINETPFFALYGFDSPTVTFSSPKLDYSESEINVHLARVKQIREHCHSELLNSQSKYTEYTNRDRNEKNVSIGERVWAKLDHTVRKKLDYPISGPFEVIGKKGTSFYLKKENSSEKYLVHPDRILNNKANVLKFESLKNANKRK